MKKHKKIGKKFKFLAIFFKNLLKLCNFCDKMYIIYDKDGYLK